MHVFLLIIGHTVSMCCISHNYRPGLCIQCWNGVTQRGRVLPGLAQWGALILCSVSKRFATVWPNGLYLCNSSLADLPDDQSLSTHHPGPATLIHLHRDLVIGWGTQNTEPVGENISQTALIRMTCTMHSTVCITRREIMTGKSQWPTISHCQSLHDFDR